MISSEQWKIIIGFNTKSNYFYYKYLYMNKELIYSAVDVLIKLHLVTADVLKMNDYLLPTSTIENIENLIELGDEEALKKFIKITQEYIENLRN